MYVCSTQAILALNSYWTLRQLLTLTIFNSTYIKFNQLERLNNTSTIWIGIPCVITHLHNDRSTTCLQEYNQFEGRVIVINYVR